MGTYGLYHEAATINRDAAPLIATRRWLGRALGVGGQLSARPYSTAPTKRAMANLAIDRNGMPFYHDAARRVATFFEKWNCLLEPIYKEIPIKKD